MADPAVFHRHMMAYHQAAGRDFPWRSETDLYRVVIGEVLLQRTRGHQVVPVYYEFLRRWSAPDKLSRARVATIERVIRPLGLTKRAPVLKQLGMALAVLSDVPTEPAELLKLPGIGPYGAHAVPCFALDRNLPVVDWVIARVLRRYFELAPLKRPNGDHELWDFAGELAKRGNARELWLGVLDFAAAVCKPVPLCEGCPLSAGCCYVSKDAGRASDGTVQAAVWGHGAGSMNPEGHGR